MLFVRPVRGDEDRKKLVRCFQEIRGSNAEYPMFTSHMILNGEELIGGFALESPTIYWWMDPQKAKARHSVEAFCCMESLMADRGHRAYVIPCEETSPYYKMLESRLAPTHGAEQSEWFKLFIRDLT